MSFRTQVLELRDQGKSYREIQELVGCSKATVSYYCSRREDQKVQVRRHRDHLRRTSQVPLGTQALLSWLLEYSVRRTDVADALRLDIEEVRLFAKERGFLMRSEDLTSYERVRRRRRHLKMLAVARKGGRCCRCGYHRSIRALDFHNPDPEHKEFSISQVANRAWSRVRDEIDQCLLLCANCHREEHDLLEVFAPPMPALLPD